MEEMWVCSGCRSINREHARRCYRCGAPRPDETVVIPALCETGPVLTPGIDDQASSAAMALHGQRGYISAWQFGYFCAGLWIVAIVMYLVALGYYVGTAAANALGEDFVLSSEFRMIPVVASAVALVCMASALVCHSVFLGIVAYDVPALGGGLPRYGPVRAGLFWLEAFARGGIAVFALLVLIVLLVGAVPIVLVAAFIAPMLGIVGIVGGMLLVWVTFKVGGRLLGWLAWPRTLLYDLLVRLATPEENDTSIVNHFTIAWLVSALAFPVLLAVAILAGIAIGIGDAGASSPEEIVQQHADQFAQYLTLIYLVVDYVSFFLVWIFIVDFTLAAARCARTREAWLEEGVNDAMHQLGAAASQPQPVFVPMPSVSSVYGGGVLPIAASPTTPPDVMLSADLHLAPAAMAPPPPHGHMPPAGIRIAMARPDAAGTQPARPAATEPPGPPSPPPSPQPSAAPSAEAPDATDPNPSGSTQSLS